MTTRHSSEPIVELRTTFGDRFAAEACAARLVAERFAACVQIEGPVRSTYRWRGTVEDAEEFRCVCKTSVERADACAAALVRSHAYELPELVRVVVDAAPAYAAWVRESVAGD